MLTLSQRFIILNIKAKQQQNANKETKPNDKNQTMTWMSTMSIIYLFFLIILFC